MKSKRALRVDDLFQYDIYSDPQIAPDFKGYVYISTRINEEKKYESQLFYQDFKSKVTEQWTLARKTVFSLFPDGEHPVFRLIAVVSANLVIFFGWWRSKTDYNISERAVNPEWSKDSKIYFIYSKVEAR